MRTEQKIIIICTTVLENWWSILGKVISTFVTRLTCIRCMRIVYRMNMIGLTIEKWVFS